MHRTFNAWNFCSVVSGIFEVDTLSSLLLNVVFVGLKQPTMLIFH